jgi:hypothetical protein
MGPASHGDPVLRFETIGTLSQDILSGGIETLDSTAPTKQSLCGPLPALRREK